MGRLVNWRQTQRHTRLSEALSPGIPDLVLQLVNVAVHLLHVLNCDRGDVYRQDVVIARLLHHLRL